MQLNQSSKIDFRKQRDFGQLFTEVFRFIKLNFKSILLCVLLIPGPLFLIAGAFYGYLQAVGSDPSKVVGIGALSDPMSFVSQLISNMLPYFILVVLGSLASSATINRFFILYQEREENNSINVGDIVKYLPHDMWRLFYNGLLLGLVFILIMIPIVFLAMIPFLGAMAIVIGLLIMGPQISYAFIAANYLVLRDKILVTTAYKKAWNYMSGNFWWTWLIVVCASLVVGILGFIFNVPMTILTVAKTFSRINQETTDNNSILYMIVGTIAIFGPQLLRPITTLFCVLTYHSYEEAQEGSALKEKIDQVGMDS